MEITEVNPIDGSDFPTDQFVSNLNSLGGCCHELNQNKYLTRTNHEFEAEISEREGIEKDRDYAKERICDLEDENSEKSHFLSSIIESTLSVKNILAKVLECVKEEDDEEDVTEEKPELDDELKKLWRETMAALTLAKEAELKIKEYCEERKKEKRELERRVVSLTEENRDINSLLRIALVEKEAVERKLKGNNSEQKRVTLLQRVGFGFIVGSGIPEQAMEMSGTGTGTGSSSKSDGSECEEEEVSLALTVEKIVKNSRHEVSQLRESLEESRSDNERLMRLTEKQLRNMEENALYIQELEDRERVLAQNVEELATELRETELEAARWREACELEVAAGKHEIDELHKLISIIKQELDKTKAALEISNGKLKLKEELVATAIGAQEAAERSLRLADSRDAFLRNRIEELTRQLEEADTRERSRRKARRICWPWQALKAGKHVNNRVQSARGTLPGVQPLLRHSARHNA